MNKLIAGALVASAVLAAPTTTDASFPSWQHRADGKRWRLCITAIHEYGHLPGMPFDGWHGAVHSSDTNSLMAHSERLNRVSWRWPFHPASRYQDDDLTGDDVPDYRKAR